jgi:hypothetical protein
MEFIAIQVHHFMLRSVLTLTFTATLLTSYAQTEQTSGREGNSITPKGSCYRKYSHRKVVL